MCRVIEKPQSPRDDQLRLHLIQRPTGLTQKLPPLTEREPALTFSDVADNGN